VVDSRRTVLYAAALAFLLRLPGLSRPVRPDEAGWFLVARTWHPSEDSVFGEHFVDRPPSLIALVDLTDQLGGVVVLRLLGALAAAAIVVLAARIGTLVADEVTGRWSAVVVAALTTSPLIDPVAAKGELLALPLLGLAVWAALLAIGSASAGRAAGLAFAAGLAGGAALGLKQNLVGGLVFALVLFLGSWWWGSTSRRRFLGLAGSLAAGAAVPVLATIGWALAEGVRLSELWYTVYGFRSDAARVIAESTSTKPAERIALLLVIAVGAGVVAIVAGFVVHFPEHWAADRPIAVATGAVLTVEVAGLVAGGSYWRDYLFPLVPPIAICVALLVARGGRVAGRMQMVALLSAGSAAVSLVVWFVLEVGGVVGYTEVAAGDAIEEASEPGDSLVVFGGRADVQYSSDLPSPYPHLWSLPMRTLDPEYADLVALLDGPRAPTWFVTWVSLDSWGAPGADDLAAAIKANYDRHGTGCDDNAVYLLKGVERPAITPDC
jgi:4-amino-4-deoxy-L-arabinose transferase-like glycosyltransferase